ncbi:MAG: NAD(P)-binding domain-containing protein [Planctomycetota bacterium]
MTRIFRERDANPQVLAQRTIAVIGYGNQGRSQALNLRDRGARVIVGNIEDEYKRRAQEDGFEVFPIGEAARQADVLFLLLPDEVAAEVFARDIVGQLQPKNAVVFASGYNVAYGLVQCPSFVDVLLLAPRMIGIGVRELFLSGEGFYSFLGVHQDASGEAWPVLLALADGIGTLKKGALEVSFKMEAELDLFNEQGFGPAFGRVLLTAVQTLLDAGYPKEVVLLELYMSGEFGYICREIANTGLIQQLEFHSQTSQYARFPEVFAFSE